MEGLRCKALDHVDTVKYPKAMQTSRETTDQYCCCSKEAVRIQRAFRGHIGRKMYEREVVQRDRARRMDFYNAMARRIQKTYVCLWGF